MAGSDRSRETVHGHADEHGGDGRRELRFVAPADCTCSVDLTRLATRVVAILRRRPASIVIDLSSVRSMNSQLLSTVVYIARECRSVGVPVRLEGICPTFRAWASTHGLLRHLELVADSGGELSNGPSLHAGDADGI